MPSESTEMIATPPPGFSLAAALAAQACARPDAPALICAGDTWSYARLANDSARRAAALATLPPGTVVALAAGTTALAQTLLATQWAGLPFLPLDPETATQRWPAFAARIGELAHRLDQAPPAHDEPVPSAMCTPDEPALIIATSGSEGNPKAVRLSHAALAAAAAASATRIPLAPGDVWLNCLPLCHIGGLSIFWRCLISGAAILQHERFAADAVWADIAAGRASHVSLVPAMLAGLLDAAGDKAPPPTLRCALIGGAALSRPLWQRARAAGWPLFVSYGMSEMAAQVATLPPADDWNEGRVGRPLPGVELAIGDDGRIRLRGAQRMIGYLGEPALSADEWLTTGDLGRLDNGELTVFGRADDVLVSGGLNIHPAEVEARLAACPGVRDAAVTGSPDPVWGDVVTALVVTSADEASIDDWCRQALPARLRPRRIVRVPALPRNAMGKIERQRLRAMLASGETR
jgi:o-succinylbenzoate---CoA ligase